MKLYNKYSKFSRNKEIFAARVGGLEATCACAAAISGGVVIKHNTRIEEGIPIGIIRYAGRQKETRVPLLLHETLYKKCPVLF